MRCDAARQCCVRDAFAMAMDNREQAHSYNFASARGDAVTQTPDEIVGASLLAMRRGSAVGGMRLQWQWTIASKLTPTTLRQLAATRLHKRLTKL